LLFAALFIAACSRTECSLEKKNYECSGFSINEVLVDNVTLTVSEIRYQSEGLTIQGVLAEPKQGGKRPLLLYNHGGKTGLQSLDWINMLAQNGYVVLASEFRGEGGSEGEIEVVLGETTDALNLLECGKQLDSVDESSLGVIGFSHGGGITVQAMELSDEERKQELFELITLVVNRYKHYDNIIYWQVENEPFLTGFSRAACGDLDKETLDEEIALVKSLDDRPILITDSGEFGDWFRAYSRGDVFGTSLYLYVWPRSIGFPIRYPITPGFFRIKNNLVRLILGAKPSFVVELSAEPWLLEPIVETPIDVQLDRMGIDKFNKVIDFSAKTGFNGFYLWGAEWWYWLKLQDHPEHWERAQELFK